MGELSNLLKEKKIFQEANLQKFIVQGQAKQYSVSN